LRVIIRGPLEARATLLARAYDLLVIIAGDHFGTECAPDPRAALDLTLHTQTLGVFRAFLWDVVVTAGAQQARLSTADELIE